MIRGQGTFKKTLGRLRQVVSDGVRAEITFTINAANVSEISKMVTYFTDEGVGEFNFHFMSLMGNGQLNQSLGLTPKAIIYAQEQLEELKQGSKIPLRYPKLLIRQEELDHEIAKGYGCRIFRPETLLIFPRGEIRRCPLEITLGLEQQIAVTQETPFLGCPLSWRLLPAGIPDDYVMTCISWKNH
jgi:MoaA/NifB/PqqE/SkfB family radical SAM enzyme